MTRFLLAGAAILTLTAAIPVAATGQTDSAIPPPPPPPPTSAPEVPAPPTPPTEPEVPAPPAAPAAPDMPKPPSGDPIMVPSEAAKPVVTETPTAPPPPDMSAKDYPPCTAALQDNCQNRSEAGKRKPKGRKPG